MDKFMRVCCAEDEISSRMERWHSGVRYEITGRNGDHGLYFPSVTEDEAESIDETFRDAYYDDGNLTLAGVLVELLYSAGLTLATAESLTGGMVGSTIVDVAGCSTVYYGGVIAYSNLAKMEKLGVEEDTLAEFTAYSVETALEMANGLLSDSVKIAVSTTGVAGPDGGTAEHPVGFTCIAVTDEDNSDVYVHYFSGDRQSIRKQATNFALFHTIQHIRTYFKA